MTGLQAFLYAIGQQESGGRYSDVNTSSGALGKYQVMPSNVAGWTNETFGHSLTPAQFLASPSAQDAVAKKILGGYYTKYGAAGAASAWYSGNPHLATSTAPQHGGPSVAGYVNSVLAKMNAALGGKATAPTAPAPSSTTATASDASFGGAIEGGIKDLATAPFSLLGLPGKLLSGGVNDVEDWASKLAISATALVASASLIVLGLYVAVHDRSGGKDDDGGGGGGGMFAMPTPASAATAVEANPELAAVAL